MFFRTDPAPTPTEWAVIADPVDYRAAEATMEARAKAIYEGTANEAIWLLEHPPLYTAGTSAQAPDLLTPERFPVFSTGRGGQYTYHGPGQRVAYLMLDLKHRTQDVRLFVEQLEAWLIDVLASLDVRAETRQGRVGLWVTRNGGKEDKIAALGIRLTKWISFHGVSLNVAPDLSHYSGIVPCGINEYGVTSLADLGIKVSMKEVDALMYQEFKKRFGKTQIVEPPMF